MRNDELDRILSRTDELDPSSGFTRSVMDAVRREALAPEPIPFPWKRALPGLVLCILSLAAMGVAAFLRPGLQRLPEVSGPSMWTKIWTTMWTGLWTGLSDLGRLLLSANIGVSGWILLALLLTLASVLLPLRLIGRRI